jgi:hypothetical protein
MPQAWPQRIERELRTSDRPLIVTNAYPTYGDLPYRFEPLGEALIVRPSPSQETPERLVTLNVDWFEDDEPLIRLLGYDVQNEGAVRPGGQVTVDLAWQPLAPLEQPYAFFVHLVGADGVPLGQRDRRHDRAETYEPGEVLIDRYSFPVYLTAAPGTYRLIVGVYLPFEDGSWVRLTTEPGHDTLPLAEVAIATLPTAPVTLHPLYVPYQDRPGLAGLTETGPVLVGLDYDDTLPSQRRVYLHWRAGERAAQAQLYSGQTLVAAGTVRGVYRDAPPVDRSSRAYVTVALDVPAGTRNLHLALQREGRTLPARGAWGILRRTPQPMPDPGPGRAHHVPFGGKLALIGARTGGSWTPGGQGRVALRFLGLRPIVRDYVVSVGVQGSAATDAPSDGVPAIGAMPTFKWIGGSVVNDVHLIRVLEGGEARLSVGLYDAFTTGALPPLDERIAQLGRAGVPLNSVSIP